MQSKPVHNVIRTMKPHVRPRHIRLPLLLLLLHMSAILARTPLDKCFAACRFTLCRRDQTVLFGSPGAAIGAAICLHGKDLRFILKTSEASIFQRDNLTPISQYSPPGLSFKYPSDYFYAAKFEVNREASAPVRRPSRGNQNAFTDLKCVVLPIRKYEIVERDRIRTISTNHAFDCVSFTAIAPLLVVEVRWFSGDDLDLKVVHSDGAEVSTANQRAGCGFHVADAGVDGCGVFGSNRERVVYDSCFAGGKYVAEVRHASNCGKGASYRLSIIRGGRVIRRIEGRSNAKDGQLILKFPFAM